MTVLRNATGLVANGQALAIAGLKISLLAGLMNPPHATGT